MNYLAAEDRLVELLNPLKNVGLRAVNTVSDISQVKAKAQTAPSANVVYYRDHLKDSGDRREVSQIEQLWLVVLITRSNQKTSEVGELLDETIKAIQGQIVSMNKSPAPAKFKRVNSPLGPVHHGGFSYYPLAFSHQLKQSGV